MAHSGKRDEKAEDPLGADFSSAVNQAISIPCLAGGLSGLFLFSVLAAVAYRQIGTLDGQNGQVPTIKALIPTNHRWPVNHERSVATFITAQVDPNIILDMNPNKGLISMGIFFARDSIDEPHEHRVQDGEMYASGLGRLHRIDQLREYQSDVLRTHGKMMAQRANGPDVGPYLAFLRPSTTTRELIQWPQLVLHPEGVLLLLYGSNLGNLYCRRLHVGLDPGAKEAWRRGSQWSPIEMLVAADSQMPGNTAKYRVENPVALFDKHLEVLRVVYTGRTLTERKKYFLYMISSHDQGTTWTYPEQIYHTPGVRSLPNVIRPSYAEYSLPVLKEEHLGSGVTTLNMLHSEDHTLMFKEYKFYDDPKAFHTSVVQLKDGKTVLAYTAVKEVGHLRLSTSHDGGRTWQASVRTDIPSPCVSWHTAVVLNSGRIALLFINHGETPKKHSVKSPLSIAISTDGTGKAFAAIRDLELADPKQLGGSGSIEGFDYPSLVQTPDGYLHIAYTCTTHGAVSNFVKYIVIDEAYVLEGSKFAAHTGLYRGVGNDSY